MSNIKIKVRAFTLAELLVALMVMSIIMSAVATLAYALGTANKTVTLMGRNQTVLNHVTLQLYEIIKNSNQITSSTQKKIELWSDKNADGIIDADEEFAIEARNIDNILYINGTEYSQCKNVQVSSENSGFVYVFFDIQLEQTTKTYQVAACIRGSDKHAVGG